MNERTSENLVELLRNGTCLGFGASLREQAAQRIEELEDTNAALLRAVDRQSNLLAGGSEHAAICVPIEAAKDAEIERLQAELDRVNNR